MIFELRWVSSVSACFERVGRSPYYAENRYVITLEGIPLPTQWDTNVFSLFDLSPDTEYTVGVAGEPFTLTFRTASESAVLDVRDFGAVGDGATLDTAALQMAIDACPPRGRVRVPEGLYRTGALLLHSELTLELCEGATLLGSTDRCDYPLWPGEVPCGGGELWQVSSWEGEPRTCHQSLLTAHGAHELYIVGQGVIDGDAARGDWWIQPKTQPHGRPRMLFANRCRDIALHGITVRNSPSWNLHPFFSQEVGFYDMAVEAPPDSPNTDGCDPESCDGVTILGVRFSVGDDAVAIKSGKLYMGQKYKTPARRHTIRNCLMEFAHGAVVLGSEMSGGVRELSVSQCLFRGTDRGLRIKTRRGRGQDAVIDGVLFENIRMESVLTPLVINMFYFCDPDGKSDYVQSRQPLPVDERTPYLGRFVFRDMVCTDSQYAAGFFFGLPEQPIASVTLENVSIHMRDNPGAGQPAMMCGLPDHSAAGLCFTNVQEVTLRGVTLTGIRGEAVVAEGVEQLHGVPEVL